MSLLSQPTANGLSKALYLKEGVPVFWAALPAYDDGVSAELRLIEELLHQKLVLNIVIGKLINAEKIKTAVIPDASLESLRVFSLQPHQFSAEERIGNPAGTFPFLARLSGIRFP